MSFRSSARNRVGSLSNFKSSAPPAAVQHDDSDDSEDHYDYDSEEEEERLLSRRHGEAQEDPHETRSNNNNNNNNNENDKKRKPTDEEIAAEYNKNDKNQKKQRVSRRARAITEMDLVQPNGLSTIFTTFPALFRKQNYPTNRRKDMAKFSRQLILAYQQWSKAIVPTTPFEEVAWRIQTLNSKTSVKRFLQTMRNQVRNQHVERIYGLEKADQMIAQLDMALFEQQDDTVDDNNNDTGLDNHDGAIPEDQDMELISATAPPEEDPTLSVPPNMETNTTNSNNTTDEDTTSSVARNTITPTPAIRKPTRRHVLNDSSDEEELTFDDDEDDKDAHKTPRPAPPSMRRPVLQESDDEDDNPKKDSEIKKTAPPVPADEVENPRNDDSDTIHNEKGSDTDGLATENSYQDVTPPAVTNKPSTDSPVEHDETNPGIIQHADDNDDHDDDDEAEFEFDTQPVHPKIPTTTVTPVSETLDESSTGLDVNAETTQMVESHEVYGESGLDHDE